MEVTRVTFTFGATCVRSARGARGRARNAPARRARASHANGAESESYTRYFRAYSTASNEKVPCAVLCSMQPLVRVCLCGSAFVCVTALSSLIVSQSV